MAQVEGEMPVVDLSVGDERRTATAVDHALREVGFMLVTGHGIDRRLIDEARSSARAFFHSTTSVKEAVRLQPGSNRGWTGLAEENTSVTYGVRTRPDLHETYTIGPFGRPDDAYHARWSSRFHDNVWPEVENVRESFESLYLAWQGLARTLLAVCERALGLSEGFFSEEAGRHTSTMSANWYPPFDDVSDMVDTESEQFRIGPHTDFGLFTILDRQPSAAGLQVQLKDDRWVLAPYLEDSVLINTGDLMNHWTDGRWRSTRHRVLPPSPDTPSEELISLVLFYAPPADVAIQPIGRPDVPSILSGAYIDSKLAEMRAEPDVS